MARNAKGRTGPSGVLDQVTGLIGRTGGRTGKHGGGLTTKAASFMAGFLGAEDRKGRGKRARGGRARGGRRR